LAKDNVDQVLSQPCC